ncbi:fumarylacetoacetate hydrolase family protein [Paraglaciecola chathamensis]|uniref:Fumarylacetoacetate hydrolase family protein n=1 Tax=Paraglaciecola chathamensis TaxID=368405 RepID=A0ABS0WFX2_9ALTE|nr:fumarylacetoacetate hydrolase family protein [Paraglaciecola chathamensis]MBJ2137364.1 fumarylacetoacetate hydrolase family protein [Paraglaciecola chathamensis]
MYQHHYDDGRLIGLPVGKVVCVGRNYLEHIQELNNEVPEQPLLFIKPNTALCDVQQPIAIPKGKGSCHNELEIAILIGKQLTDCDDDTAKRGIHGVGLGLDLTLREVQDALKAKGQPWERAKGFDASCPISPFVPIDKVAIERNIEFSLSVNNKVRQQGNSANMMHNISSLIVDISKNFTLLPGDIVLTGTPKGVGPLQDGDELSLVLKGHLSIKTKVT